VPHRSGIDSVAKIKFQIPPYNGKYDLAAYQDWELEVEQYFSYHDISASSHVQTTVSEFMDFALIWRRDYEKDILVQFQHVRSIESCYAT
jgi:hypothetical protein